MTMNFGALALGAAVAVALAWAVPSAEAKTRKECNAEWTANKATETAAGKTRKAFVAECLAQLEKGQFKTEAEAKASCPTDSVVWVNLRSKVYHTSEDKSYGKTKSGAYMCEKESTAGGFRAPKGAKKPV
ncbi:MAG: hypothetical protein AB7E84_06035 [Xanthobacteraceae bacterium]